MSKHIVISTGYRKDEPRNSHLWCTYCGAVEDMKLPDAIDIVLARSKSFSKGHKGCAALLKADKKLAQGFLRSGDEYVWGGLFSIDQIASAARSAARIPLDEVRVTPPELIVDPSGLCSRKAVLWLIENLEAGQRQFYKANPDLFCFPRGEMENLWDSQRVTLFLVTARAFIERRV